MKWIRDIYALAMSQSFIFCSRTQPSNGNMNVRKSRQSLTGYEGYGTIEIYYQFAPGIQGPEHPHPGQPYHPIGFPRVAYLPDNVKGQKVLKLLQKAFERRLIFTVSTVGIKIKGLDSSYLKEAKQLLNGY